MRYPRYVHYKRAADLQTQHSVKHIKPLTFSLNVLRHLVSQPTISGTTQRFSYLRMKNRRAVPDHISINPFTYITVTYFHLWSNSCCCISVQNRIKTLIPTFYDIWLQFYLSRHMPIYCRLILNLLPIYKCKLAISSLINISY